MPIPLEANSDFFREEIAHLDPQVQKRVNEWLNGPYDQQSKDSIIEMLKSDLKELIDAFYTDLSFGTGGLRGLMGVGSNRMNIYTVRKTTQGLANYLLKFPPEMGIHRVFIGFDSRHHSSSFASEAARVLAANEIEVDLVNHLRPTPFVSFACRYKKCSAAIMITASHNPAKYNGYKVYWSDGGQVVPPHDVGIMDEVEAIHSLEQVKLTEHDNPLIRKVDESVDIAYYQAIHPLRLHPNQDSSHGHKLKITYTSLHGTGVALAPSALRDWGFTNLNFVEKQMIPDGNFPTVKVPNPEYKEALQLGIEDLIKTKSDLLIATDPDADRMGIAVLHHGKPVIISGNEVAAICINHICETLKEKNKIPEKAAFVTTIVSTDLLKAISMSFQIPCFEVLTGFKYIAEKIHIWENSADGYHFLFGAEESYGYLFGTVARDKDAIISSCLISEIALDAKIKNLTLIDLLYQIYLKFGIYREKQLSLSFTGIKGLNQISHLMNNLRQKLLKTFAGHKVVSIEDYEIGVKHYLDSGKKEVLALPKSNVLLFRLENEHKIVVRPSGTEPKIKIYAGVKRKDFSSIEQGISQCDDDLEKMLAYVKNYFSE